MSSGHQSEYDLENKLIQKLNAIGYKSVKLPDVESMVAHFRQVMNEYNAEALKGTPLSDDEFKRVQNELRRSQGIFETGKLLRGTDTSPYGRVAITRDDNTPLTIYFFDGKDWNNNIFEVTHQITNSDGLHENRYDVTILINGLPVTQIELKRRGVDFTQAFNQILRYRTESLRTNFLFNFLQFFVVSNGGETRYFANGDGKLNSNFMFYWTDEKNTWLNELDLFTVSFFDPVRLHSMIAKYTIFDEDNSRMIVMRPYQVYAVEAIIKQAQEHPEKNGYIWHTTGSGKTITSFKAARLLAQNTKAEKVIFLIDRSDLDIQTAKNFNSYLPKSGANNEPALDRTTNTKNLVSQLTDTSTQLIITTIQKLNNAVTSDKFKNILAPYHDKRVIFIEDEAHRSQFGEMRKNVNKWFMNAQHFGFTGTPIFKENIGKDGRTTDDLYDERLHSYLIKDAIRDRNVLAFNVEYINTIQGHGIVTDEDTVAKGIDKKEVWENPERLKMIAQHIVLNHGNRSKGRHYNAIFAVPNTRVAVQYYEIFKEMKTDLNVSSIFTWNANEADNEDNQGETAEELQTSRLGLDKIIADYNTKYGTNFSTDEFPNYFADVSKRMKEQNENTKEDNIDILIVVNMFLTGFDAPRMSTLYLDKKLQWHNLIQAYSRTNRVEEKSKPFGNIVSYRNLKKATDEAVTLFSDGDKSSFFAPDYNELHGEFVDNIVTLRKVVPTPESVDALYNATDEELAEFVQSFRDVLRTFNKINVYDEFDWANFSDFSEQDLESYRGKYYAAYEEWKKRTQDGNDAGKVSVLDDIDFELDLIARDVIDVSYIVKLIRAITPGDYTDDVRKIKRLLNNADSKELKTKAELLAEFLDEVVPQLQPGDSVPDSLNNYLIDRRNQDIEKFAKENELEPEFVDEKVNDYEFAHKMKEEEMSTELAGMGFTFMKTRSLKKKIVSFVEEAVDKYILSYN